MKVFISGGTGFIGSALTQSLIHEGHSVTLLVRNPDKSELQLNDNLKVVKGDILDKTAVEEGMTGCDWVFHLASHTHPWYKKPEEVISIIETGTANIFESALKRGVKRVVFTSTGGTMGYSRNDQIIDETTNPEPDFITLYERCKSMAERTALSFCKNGLEIITVNPTRVYGPGILSKSNSITRIMNLYNRGLWRIIPGDGNIIGNYVFIRDVVSGHILAAKYGKTGERYILGGENLSFMEIFTIIGTITGKERRMIKMPLNILKTAVKTAMLFSDITGIHPAITNEWFEKYMKNSILSSEKAKRELGYGITPFITGAGITLNWLKTLG